MARKKLFLQVNHFFPKSEAANVEQRQIDWIKAKIERGEESGFTADTKAQILAQSKSLLDS
ncbi:MAG: hypothetical protein COA33_002375 [Fluviicola sp.]|nr:hypothetical protein [Fluviicola sp.]